MKLKSGVLFDGIKAPTLRAMAAAEDAFLPYGEVVVTSIKDGIHSANSLHYDGLAFDLRTRHMTLDQVEDAVGYLRRKLGPDYDVVIEATHAHVEYQPKVRP